MSYGLSNGIKLLLNIYLPSDILSSPVPLGTVTLVHAVIAGWGSSGFLHEWVK